MAYTVTCALTVTCIHCNCPPTLQPPATTVAAAHRNIEAPHDGAPYNLFLILRFGALKLYAASAVRALLRQRNADPLIHARRARAAGVLAVVTTGFAAGPLRIGLQPAPGMRRSLPLTGPQGRLQFLP